MISKFLHIDKTIDKDYLDISEYMTVPIMQYLTRKYRNVNNQYLPSDPSPNVKDVIRSKLLKEAY